MLRSFLVFGILATGIGVALFNRFAALSLYVWFALFRPQEFLWFDISEWHLSLWIGALLVIPALLTGVFPNFTHVLSIGSMLFLFSGLLAQSNAFDSMLAWAWLDYLARLILVSLLAVTLISTRRRFLWMVGIIAGSFGFYPAKAGLGSILGGGIRYFDGQAGAFQDNNAYAVGTAMIMPLLIVTAQNLPTDSAWSKPLKWLLFIAVPSSMLLVVSTFSRAGFLALIAAILTFTFLQRRRWSIMLAFLLTLLVVGPFIPIPAGYFDRIETIRTYSATNEDSALGRLHFWRVAIDMAAANPLGVGLQNFETAYDRYDFLNGTFGHRRSVHNSHFQVLTEMGFVGAAIWLFLFFYAFMTAWGLRRRALNGTLPADQCRFFYTSANGLITSMIAFVVGGAFISMALNDLTWFTFALVASLDRLSRQAQAQTEPLSDVLGAPVAYGPVPALEPAAFGAEFQ